VDDAVDGVDHVIRAERVAVLKLHALSQSEIDRGGVHLLSGRGQIGLDLQRQGIAIDQSVEGLDCHDHAGAQRIGIGIGVGDRVAPGNAQRVDRLLRKGRTDAASVTQAAINVPRNHESDRMFSPGI
jgi:hypothetical protein